MEQHEIKLNHYKARVAQYEETIADLKVQIAVLKETAPAASTPRRATSS